MAENYKHLYEQMKKMVAMYQDEIVPGMREQLEKCVKVVRCKDCKHYTEGMAVGMCKRDPERPLIPIPYNHYCGFAERKEDGKE
jgi:hypothetical protein